MKKIILTVGAIAASLTFALFVSVSSAKSVNNLLLADIEALADCEVSNGTCPSGNTLFCIGKGPGASCSTGTTEDGKAQVSCSGSDGIEVVACAGE